jgi:hypothetical protein
MAASKNPVQFGGSLSVSLMSLFCREEKPKVIIPAIGLDVSLPFLSSIVPRDALFAAFVRGKLPKIAHVLMARRDAKVRDAVVGLNTINVIDFAVRPFAVMHGPCNSMSTKKDVVDSRDDVSGPVPARYFAARLALSAINAPKQTARDRVVGEKFFQASHGHLCHAG